MHLWRVGTRAAFEMLACLGRHSHGHLHLQMRLAEFEDYIKQHKTVALDELAAEFGMRTQDAIARVQDLEASGRLTGVMDDRGKVNLLSLSSDEFMWKWTGGLLSCRTTVNTLHPYCVDVC